MATTTDTEIHYLEDIESYAELVEKHQLVVYPEPSGMGHFVRGTRQQVLAFHSDAGLPNSVNVTTINAF